MKTRICAQLVLVAALGFSGAAQAALQGRDLNGSAGSFEAYYDTVLNVTWLADANHAKTSGYDADGLMLHSEAETWAANLTFYDAINNITYDNWRLPTVKPVNGTATGFNYNFTTDGSSDIGYNLSKPGTAFAGSTRSEMAYMFYSNLGNPGYYNVNGTLSGCLVSYPGNTCLDNVGPFSNLQAEVYWSDWNFSFTMYYGYQSSAYVQHPLISNGLAWAVTTGDVAAVPEMDTWAMLLAGLGFVGVAARRRKQAEV